MRPPRSARPAPKPLRLGSVLVLLAALAACGDRASGAASDQPPGIPDRYLGRIGAESPDDSAGLSMVIAGRVTASGEHIAVLDFRPPFIKVFHRDGRLRAAFPTQGRGPLETRGASVLAVAGDSLVLVSDVDGRLFTFDLDGRLRHHVPSFGIPVLSATSACDGEWLLYGPRIAGDGRSARWLHRLPVGAGAEAVTSLLEAAAPSGGLGFGRTYGLVGSGGGAVLRHDLGTAPAVVSWRCGAPSAAISPVDEEIDTPALEKGREGAMVGTIGPGTRMRGGLAAFADGSVVRAELVNGGAGEPDRTELTLFRGGEATTRTVPGFQSLLDSRPGVGVLIRTDREDGKVVLVSERDFLSVFGPADAGP